MTPTAIHPLAPTTFGAHHATRRALRVRQRVLVAEAGRLLRRGLSAEGQSAAGASSSPVVAATRWAENRPQAAATPSAGSAATAASRSA